MIDSSPTVGGEAPLLPAVPGAPSPPEPGGLALLPVSSGIGRFLVLLTVFVCAACGLVYELELVALASYLTGDSVTHASVVLSLMVFSMGVGSLLAKRLRFRAAIGFGMIEAALALVGGGSAMAMYACFAWLQQSYTVLVGFSFAIGVLIGAEVPLLMTLIQRVRRQDAGGAVADLFAADYVGALVGGLAFPFLLLPAFGQLTGALLTGTVNAVAGAALVLWLFRGDLTVRARCTLIVTNLLVLTLLAVGSALTGPFERAARRAVYGAEVRVAIHTGVQEVVLTGGERSGEPLRLYLDGRLRFSARDAFRYREALVHPAMAGPHRRVLVLGGGDGLAVREILRYPDVRSVTVVELDPEVVRLARTHPDLSALNGRALDDPRVRVVSQDAFDWLRGRDRRIAYDVVVSDLTAPSTTSGSKLYSQEFYGLVRRAMAPDGRLAVHAGTLRARPQTYWTVDATVRSVGLRTVPYAIERRAPLTTTAPDRLSMVTIPRDWGFLLAARSRPGLRLAAQAPPLRWLTPTALRAASRGAAAERKADLPVSTLMHPRYAG